VEIKEKQWTKVEDAVLEYKSSDYLKGKDNNVIADLAGDIKTKFKTNPFKIYVVGVEANGTLYPIDKSRLPGERIEAIRSGLIDKLKGVGSIDIYPMTIPVDHKCLLLIAVNLKS
jgi:hypothetical protein